MTLEEAGTELAEKAERYLEVPEYRSEGEMFRLCAAAARAFPVMLAALEQAEILMKVLRIEDDTSATTWLSSNEQVDWNAIRAAREAAKLANEERSCPHCDHVGVKDWYQCLRCGWVF